MNKLIIIYQPHQNIRQHQIWDDYPKAFEKADKVYWLPTYLVREDPNLEVLSPERLTQGFSVPVETMDWGLELKKKLDQHRLDGDYIIFMGAGPIDESARDWARKIG